MIIPRFNQRYQTPPQPHLKGLTGPQLRQVLFVAGQIAPPAREKFLRAVAANLNGQAEVGDGRLDKLIRKLLEEFYLERSVRLRAAMSRKNFRERGYESDWTRLAREFKRA
jgi:hypothetical protein